MLSSGDDSTGISWVTAGLALPIAETIAASDATMIPNGSIIENLLKLNTEASIAVQAIVSIVSAPLEKGICPLAIQKSPSTMVNTRKNTKAAATPTILNISGTYFLPTLVEEKFPRIILRIAAASITRPMIRKVPAIGNSGGRALYALSALMRYASGRLSPILRKGIRPRPE